MTCEFKCGCTVAQLYEQRLNLSHEKTALCMEVVEGPDDLQIVNGKMNRVDQIKHEINNLDTQIGAQVVCSKCPWTR